MNKNVNIGGLSLGAAETRLPIKVPMGNTGSSLKFSHRKVVGKFWITKDEKYSEEEEEIAPLISEEKMKTLIGRNLGVGYDSAVKLMDYVSYHKTKQDFFVQWLQNTQYFKKVDNGEFKKPKFICFGGRVTDPLQTPLITRYGAWKMLGAKYLDTVFLWDEKIGSHHQHTKSAFYGIALGALLTGKEPSQINEYEKMFVVQEICFGSHQLLIVNEIDGEECPEEWAEFIVFSESSPKAMQAKYLKKWAQSIVSGSNTLIAGERDDSGVLRKIQKLSLEDVLKKANYGRFAVNQCLAFEDRLLTWIHAQFTANDPTLVKEFSWAGSPSTSVQCKQLHKGEYQPYFSQSFLDANK